MKDIYNLSREENMFLAKKVLVNNIYSLARIEGVNVTFPQTQLILSGINVPKMSIDDIQCILNLRNAWKFVLSDIDSEFDLKFICRVNEDVARNESLKWGVLRTGGVGITGTEHRPGIPTEQTVNEKLLEIKKFESATERAIEYFLYATREQLFWDGNKRTSLICANKIMIQAGAGILVVSDSDMEAFSDKLTEYYNSNDKTDLKKFLAEKCVVGIDY